MRVIIADDRCVLFNGDSAKLGDVLPPNSVDSIVADPPCGIGFMGREWDSDLGGQDLPKGFGPWLAGLCDGEANFDIHRQQRDSGEYFYPRFEMTLRADDGGLLAMLQQQVGGKIYAKDERSPSDSPGKNPTTRWEIVSREECARLVDIFDRFPLQSKKARDFAIWREAVATSAANAGTSRPDLMLPLWEQLRGTRPFAGRVTEPIVFREMQYEHKWVAWLAELLAPAYRALKPGGHMLLWGIPRTSHWTMLAGEAAGFEIRDVVYHVFGTGFPKSLDVSKAVDKKLGATREVVGERIGTGTKEMCGETEGKGFGPTVQITEPATPEAERADGMGTALKPAVEPWILFRKPLDGTVAENFLRWGTGGINIDACRIANTGKPVHAPKSNPANRTHDQAVQPGATSDAERMQQAQTESIARLNELGRWPAHMVMSHHEQCSHACETGAACGGSEGRGPDCVCVPWCHPDCAVRLLDEQSGAVGADSPVKGTEPSAAVKPRAITSPRKRVASQHHGDKGGAARFFYCAKPTKKETEHGLDHLPKRSGGEATDREDGSDGLKSPRAGAGRGGGSRNFHPTKKPVALMRYLIRLVTPPGGTVLDVFAGSGTTGVAALLEGFNFVGCELTEDYIPIIEGRLRRALVDSAKIDATPQ